MQRFRLHAALLIGASLACAAIAPARAGVLVHIDKPTQTMTVTVDGAVRYRWPVSTGATKYSTPTGSYTAFRMERMHYSREWDNAGMPHSIFFTTRRHAIHGSNHPGMGTPASHGCVRLSLPNASVLYQLVAARGLTATQVVVRGPDPPGYHAPTEIPAAASPRQRQRQGLWPFGGLFGR